MQYLVKKGDIIYKLRSTIQLSAFLNNGWERLEDTSQFINNVPKKKNKKSS